MSHEYTHIIVAVDLTDDSRYVIERALPIAERTQAKLSVIHNLEPIGFAYGGDMPVDVNTLQEQLDEHARQRLNELADSFGIPREDQHILVGQADIAIRDFAEENNVDLIVVGSHGRTGFALLLGSTTSSVMRNVTCDVLAVRVLEQITEPVD